MQGTPTERALEVLGDYLFELETKARRAGGASYGPNRTISARPTGPEPYILAHFSRAAEYAAGQWESGKLAEWRGHGRITADGYLRVGCAPLAPYTLSDLMRVMSHLNVFDRLAALIDLNGVVEGGYLNGKEHENIREVVEKIADSRVALRLSDGDTAMRLRDLIRVEVAEIFGEVLTRFNSPASTLKVGGRQQKCSKCRQPGHRATTCGKKVHTPLPIDLDLSRPQE